jgi:hypothetical protein
MNKLLTITSQGAAITWNVIFITLGVIFIEGLVEGFQEQKAK